MTSSLWIAAQPLVLASKSATRRALLQAARLPVECEAPDVDERLLDEEARSSGADGQEVAALLARAKAVEVSRRRPGCVVLGADQTLACEGRIFDKPVDRGAAADQLEFLQGKTHSLHAAAALARDGVVLAECGDVARLSVRAFSPGFLETYLDLAGPAVTTSVGAYQVEGLGVHLFEQIEGSHFTVLGLPLLAVLAALRGLGLVAE